MPVRKRSEKRSTRLAERRRRKAARGRRREPEIPHLSLVRSPQRAAETGLMRRRLSVATYNVHRWTGLSGRSRPDPARAGFVISELRADVIALQEVLRPLEGEDPLEEIADALGLHVAFAATRSHRLGQIGNAVLSRWPMAGVSVLDLTFSRIERRLAMWAQFHTEAGSLDLVATHLSLRDRARHLQVRSLLDHPHFQGGPTLLVGDLNAWRNCRATRVLEDELHHNLDWPASFPSARPVLALDRIYSRGAKLTRIEAHDTAAARRASDHLPVVARVHL